MMDYKEQLLQLGHADALNVSSQELHARVEGTIAKTFMWMGAILLIAFTVAYGTSTQILPIPFSSTLAWISWIGGFGLIMLMSWRWQKMSYATLASLLLLFGLLEGYGLTGVFLSYTGSSIFQVFLMSAGMFFWLAVAGYYLHIDIARVGPILLVALIVLIVGMVVNAFWGNATFDIRLSVIGLILFAGLIIYDMNVLKQQALIDDSRIPILMSLGLFINFINIFLFLLRIFGNRN